MKYTRAPLSEVIIGVSFKEAKFALLDVFSIQSLLKDEFPRVDIRPPLADESLSEHRLNTELNPESTGPFLLRLRDDSKKWLCQIQRNKLYVNWVRSDIEEVGQYVGFEKVLGRFEALFKVVQSKVLEITFGDVSYFEVAYHDRLEWELYISSISELSKIINFQPPRISIENGFNNVMSRYTFHEPSLGGYGVLSISTDTSPKPSQVLKLETGIRGKLENVSRLEWFRKANERQVQFFEEIFKPEILRKWQ